MEQTEGDEDMAEMVVDSMIGDKIKELDGLRKRGIMSGGTIAEKIAAEKKLRGEIEDAQRVLGHWQEIKKQKGWKEGVSDEGKGEVANDEVTNATEEKSEGKASEGKGEEKKPTEVKGEEKVDATPKTEVNEKADGGKSVAPNGEEVPKTEVKAEEGKNEAKGDDAVSNGEEIAPIGKGVFGNIYDQFKGKVKEAFAFLKKIGGGEALAVLHHKDVGDIALVWGNEKAGAMKILRKHPEVVDNLQELMDGMHVVSSSDNRIVLESDTHKAVVSKKLGDKETEQWLLTAYEKKNAAKGGSSDIGPKPQTEGGKQNGTAPLQDGSSSDGKGTKNDDGVQGKGEEKTAVDVKKATLERLQKVVHVLLNAIKSGEGKDEAISELKRVVKECDKGETAKNFLISYWQLDRLIKDDGGKVSENHALMSEVLGYLRDALEENGVGVIDGVKGVKVGDVVCYKKKEFKDAKGYYDKTGRVASVDRGSVVMDDGEKVGKRGVLGYCRVGDEGLKGKGEKSKDGAAENGGAMEEATEKPSTEKPKEMAKEGNAAVETATENGGATEKPKEKPATEKPKEKTKGKDAADDGSEKKPKGDGVSEPKGETVSEGEQMPTEKKPTERLKGEKSEDGKGAKGEKPTDEPKGESEEKIDDVGEKIAGARKDELRDMAKKFGDVTLESLIALPFAKVFKRPKLKEAVEKGVLRKKDARFADAVMCAFLSKAKPRLLSGWLKSEKSKREIEAWAKEAYNGVKLLKMLMDGDEKKRDALIEDVMGWKMYNEEEVKAKQRQLEEWNEGRKFEGECYPINPVKMFMDVFERLGYDSYGELKLPFAEVRPDMTFDSYNLYRANGKRLYLRRDLTSYDDVVDEAVYLTKLMVADEDLDHPKDRFKLKGEDAIYETVGWIVNAVTVKGKKQSVKQHVFKTKEEAEKFREEFKGKMGKDGYVSSAMEDKRFEGWGSFEIAFHNDLTDAYVDTGLKFKTREEAAAAIDEEHERLNEIVNGKLREGLEAAGEKTSRKKDSVSVMQMYKDGKWGYAVALDDKYAPRQKTSFNTMPYTLAEGFETKEEAEKYIEEHREEIDARVEEIKKRRREFVYFNGKDNPRVGEDYRKGEDVTAEQFREQFGFRGVQFGNWTNQRDRQAAVNNAFDGFMDLARVLGVSPRALSLNGELGIAFGARGGGKASAHYELNEVVINLTKTKGAGSLAHEWWHALDNYFARRGNVKLGMVTEGKGIRMREELRSAFNALVDEVAKSDYDKRSSKEGGYWGSRSEETARLFETWVSDELMKRGEVNNFLTSRDPMSEEKFARMNYLEYKWFAELAGKEAMSFEDYRQTASALNGFVYPSRGELDVLGLRVRKIFDTIQTRVDEATKNVVMYHRGRVVERTRSMAERALLGAVIGLQKRMGLSVLTDVNEGQRVLDVANGGAKLSAARRSKEAEERDRTLRAIDYATALVTGRTPKEAQMLRRERERVFKKETKDLYERVLAGNFDEVTLQQIDNFINNVTPLNPYGRPLSKRLPQRVGQKVSEGEREGSIDALFSRISESSVRPNERFSSEGKRRIEEKKKELLKGWAIATGNWHTDVSDFTDAKEPIGKGKDSDVYVGNDGKSVIKVSKGKDNLKRFRPDMDNVALFNYVFRNSRYEILGYGEIDGKFVRFLRQPIVDFTESVPLSVKERVSYMEGLGFRAMNDEKTAFTNGVIVASDIQGNNIVKDKDGNIRVIDADMRLHTKDVGGEYSYPDVERDMDVPHAENNDGARVREHRVFHGSGAEFDKFDHSHMGEGEGAQAFGWGTYVTEVEGIGRTYAEMGKDGSRNLYSVEIPDDNGNNYFYLDRRVSAKDLRKIEAWVKDYLMKNEGYSERDAMQTVRDFHLGDATGYELVNTLRMELPEKEVSKMLSEMGYVGSSFPSNWEVGFEVDLYGKKRDYVVFNEGDLAIVDHVKFFRTRGGEAYGFTVGGRIYLDPRVATAETAVHEYAHLWTEALREANRVEWDNVVELMKGTKVWDEVKGLYPELKGDDEVADEVVAMYSGRRGAERLREEMRKVMEGNGSLKERAAAVSALGRVRDALKKFWSGVADFLGIHFTSAEEVADKVMADMLRGVDPTKVKKGERVKEQIIGERGAERLDREETERGERMRNLEVAKEMEKEGRDAKMVKLATGWERGKDGMWRYEVGDLKYHPNGDAEYNKLMKKQPWSKELEVLEDRLFNGEQLSESENERFDELAAKANEFKTEFLSRERNRLADWVESKELFGAYPELKNVEILFTDQLPKEEGGYYSEKDKLLVVNTSSDMDIESVIAHEVQHAIQSLEGFARGGNIKSIEREFNAAKAEWSARAYARELEETAKELGDDYNQVEVENALLKEYAEMDMSDWLPDKDTRVKGFNYFARGYADRSLDDAIKRYRLNESSRADFNPYLEYRKLAGEVEARNVQKRMGLSQEERRGMLASETEDVARDEQVLLFGDEKGNAMAVGEPYDYEKYPLGRVEKGLAEREVSIVDGDEKHGFKNYADAKEWAKGHIVRTYDEEETGGKGRIRISNTAIGKFLSESAVGKSESKDVHMAVLKVLPEVLKTSIDAETHPDFLKGEDGERGPKNGMNRDVLVHRLYGAVRMGGKLYRVKVTLKENVRTKETNNAYSYEATKIELLEGTISKTEGSRDLEPSNSKPELSAGQHGNVFGLTSTFPRYSDNSIAAAKLLKGVEKTYEPGKKLLDESENSALYRDGDNLSSTEKKENSVASRVKKAVERIHKEWRGAVSDLASRLGLEGVDVVEGTEGLTEKQRGAKGWFDKGTGRIVVVLGNHRSKGDVMRTVLHEGVCHFGLRGLMGEGRLGAFLDGVFAKVDEGTRKRIAEEARKHGWNVRVATEEYLASLAENTNFEDARKGGVWKKVKLLFGNVMRSLGFGDGWLTDNELRFVLRMSYDRLKRGGRESLLDRANRIALERRLKVGRFEQRKPLTKGEEKNVEKNVLYREDRDRIVARDDYEREVSAAKHKLNVAWADSMSSLKILQDAIGRNGGKIEDWENAYMAENRMSSKNLAEMEAYKKSFYKDLIDAVDELTSDGKATYDGVKEYMLAKHGLERNDVFAMRDAKRKADDITSKKIRKLEGIMNNPYATTETKVRVSAAINMMKAMRDGVENVLSEEDAKKWYDKRLKAIEGKYKKGKYTDEQRDEAKRSLRLG